MSLRRFALIVFSLAGTSCADDPVDPGPTVPPPPLASIPLSLCHRDANGTTVLEVSEPALSTHLGHGDYRTELRVDHGTPPTGWEVGVRFNRISDAVQSARDTRIQNQENVAGACRITIEVARGTYTGTTDPTGDPGLERFPLLIDVPDITLRGSMRMSMDDFGRPIVSLETVYDAAVLAPNRPLVDSPAFESLILVVHNNEYDSGGDRFILEGFTFNANREPGSSGGIGIVSDGVSGLDIRGNHFPPGLTSAADLRMTQATLTRNYLEGMGASCGFCMAGPGGYEVRSNIVLAGALGGLYLSPSVVGLPWSKGWHQDEDLRPLLPAGEPNVTALIENNLVRGHRRLPIGFALRVLSMGPGTPNLPQSATVVVRDNEFVQNTFAIVMDAGFPVASGVLRGDQDVTLSGNTLSPSCQAELLVAFTRHTGALGTTTNPFLRNSRIWLRQEGGAPVTPWYSHPAGLGNSLVIDGVEASNGTTARYDPARTCP